MNKRPFWLLLVLCTLSVALVAAGVFTPPRQDQIPGVIQLSSSGYGRGHAVAYSPDGAILAVGSSLGLHLYDASTLELSYFIPTDTWVRSLAFSPDGLTIATGSYDSIVRIWRVSDGSLLHELSGHTAWVRSVAFSPDGSRLATASDDNTVRIWQTGDWSTLRVMQENTDGVRTLAFSPDGTLLATSGFDNIIRLWSVRDGTLLRELSGHTGWVRALAFSPDGLWLASGGFDATVRLWSVQSGELMVTRHEHASSVLGLAFSPDGALLASASVDTTVRLWSMPSLEPFALLQGHEDFVYAVAFSLQGTTLASASTDNTVRLWDVPQEVSADALQTVSSPKNCAACHHPRAQVGPARVIEPGCEVCHGEGALARNWCPTFIRSQSWTTVAVTLRPVDGSGVFSQSESAAVIIYTPGNGEVLYGQAKFAYPLVVSGKVFYVGNLDDVTLTLDVISDGVVVDSAVDHPSPDGTFSFNLVGNLGGLTPAIPQRSEEDPCLKCHLDVYDAAMPNQGSVYLRVNMSVGDELRAWDERLVYMDHGGTVTVPVEISSESGLSLQGIPVQAGTILYEWRGRSFEAISNADGETSLQVEVLEHVPVTYQVSVPPVIVDGIQYESLAPVELVLPPGATDVPSVALTVRANLGSIDGHMEGIESPLDVWVIQLPSGFTRTVSVSSQGDFFVSDLFVGEYLITFDPVALASRGLSISSQQVDLADELSTQVQFRAVPLQGVSLSGTVSAEGGSWLPFTWVTTTDQTGQSDPDLGTYTLTGLPELDGDLVVTAPGYYSQPHRLQESPLDFILIPRPEMESFPWGTGSVFLPPETVASVDGLVFDFTQGWLWGKGSAQHPLVLRVDDVRIEIPSGRFALERLPAQAAWFYLFDGTASVQTSDGSVLEMSAGQMLRIFGDDALQGVAYNSYVVRALLPVDASPLTTIWQPTLWQRLVSSVEKFGVGSAKVVTFITYLMIIISLLVVPLSGVYSFFKHKNTDKTEDHKIGDIENHDRR